MPFDLSDVSKLHVVGSTFGSCASEMEEEPHGYRWLEDRATNGRFRLLRLQAHTEETVGDAALDRLRLGLEEHGVCFWRDVSEIAAIAAGAMDLFMRAWPDQLDFDRIHGRCVMVALDYPGDEAMQPVHTIEAEPTRAQRCASTEAVGIAPANLQDWLRAVFTPDDRHTDLFKTEANNGRIVTTVDRGSQQVQVLERHPDMCARVRQLARIVVHSHGHCGSDPKAWQQC